MFGALGRHWPKADWAPRMFRAKSTFQSLERDGAEGYALALAVIPPELRHSLYSPTLRRALGDYRAEQPLVDLMHNAPAHSGLDRRNMPISNSGCPETFSRKWIEPAWRSASKRASRCWITD